MYSKQAAARITLDRLTAHERTLLAELDKLRYVANEADGLHAYESRTFGAIGAAIVQTLTAAIETHTQMPAVEAKPFAEDIVGEMTRSYISAVEMLDYAANTESA